MDYLNQDDMRFMLFDWLQTETLLDRAVYAEHDRGTLDQVLDLSAKLARETFAQHFKVSDTVEPKLVDGKVVLPPETVADITAFRDAGFFALPFRAEDGGLGLPTPVCVAAMGNFYAANTSTAAYPFLATGNANLLLTFGSEAQKVMWAKPQIEGRFFGTMCLSEPQAGSSLGDICTRAEFDGDDALGPRYRLKGNKMWISGGAHEMGENIVHLVLAKVPDDTGNLIPGIGGISIFVVPKILPDGTENDIAVAGLNHKMGYRGTSNCLLNFGERIGAVGWRVGALGQGLPIMFQMMNEARIGVGMGAACMAYRGYVQSCVYAQERLQGRAIGQKSDGTDSPQIPIIEHTDVKRMLLAQKAYAEGAIALVLYSAKVQDEAHTHPDPVIREENAELLDLLTPVTKSWPSDYGVRANDLAIQVHGGYGYTRDFDVEQLYRDNRLNPIHEGTFGIQAADLLGRKLGQKGGEGYVTLIQRINQTIQDAIEDDFLIAEIGPFQQAVNAMQKTVGAIGQMGRTPALLDNAAAFLSGFGHVVVGWLWVSQILALDPADESDFAQGKRSACKYFLRLELPKAITDFAQVERAETCISECDPAWF